MVSNPAELASMVGQLSLHSRLALDTESDSFFSYYPKVCLIQITTFADAHNPDPAHVVDFLVDPLSQPTLEPLGALIAGGQHEVIMHAAENDILLMRRSFDFRFPRVFDTQLAARILGWPRVGLGAILEECFGVVSDKRMQRTDWSSRPLSAQQIAYAQMDTHYLLTLRDLLMARLEEEGRLEEAELTMRRAMPAWRRDAMVFFGANHLAMLLAEQGRLADAARIDSAATAYVQRTGSRPSPVITLARRRTLELFEAARLDPADVARWRREGATLDESRIAALCVQE
jgi:hypothetical protein